MTALSAADVRRTWVPSEISAAAGKLPGETARQANDGDRECIAAVDAFLSNPAATALWGDICRHALLKVVRIYAGKDLLLERAVLKFASELRTELAGPNPDALDLILAERVVIAWAFVTTAEMQYARRMQQEPPYRALEFDLKRIDLANRQLLAAARTLAKVRRVKLPDVMAVVTLTADRLAVRQADN